MDGCATPIKRFEPFFNNSKNRISGAKLLTRSKSKLKFGEKSCCVNEEDYVANIAQLKKLVWWPQFDLKRVAGNLKKGEKNCHTR